MQFIKQKKLVQENMQIKEDIEELVLENSRIVEIILEELEHKIREIKEHDLISMENIRVNQKQETVVNNGALAKKESDNVQTEEIKFNIEHEEVDKGGQLMEDIISLKEQGFSLQEIAEQLKMSQGEISLNLRLQERLQAVALAEIK